MEIEISSNTEGYDTEAVVVYQQTELGIHISLSIPVNLRKKEEKGKGNQSQEISSTIAFI